MTKKNFINGLKCSLVITLFALLGIYSSACACNEMDSDKVYNNFVEFVESSDNIFEFEEKTINSQKVKHLKINIPYDPVISEKLSYEVNGYTPTDEEYQVNDVTKYNRYINATIVGYKQYLENPSADANFSDFYILKAIYEPMLEVATYQIGQNYITLKNNVETLSKEKANEVNEKLNKVAQSAKSVKNSVTVLNNNKYAFAEEWPEKDGEGVQDTENENITLYKAKPIIFKYRDKQNNIYFELKNIKKNFEDLIMDCFDLNKSFMELYLSIRTNYDFETIKEEDFINTDKNAVYKVVLNDYLNYMLTMASFVAFSIDGGQCSFINSTNSFASMYSNIVENTDNGKVIKNFANRYIYQENLIQIYNVYTNKNLFDFYDDYRDTLKASYLPYIINCQYKFNAFMQQYDNFKNSLDGVNYKNYIMSEIYKDADKTYMDYAMTLTGDERTKFIVVHEFMVNYYAPLAKALSDLQAEMLK